MRVQRVIAAAALAFAAFGGTPAATAGPADCVVKPQSCYVCVMYPCYPQDWPPYLQERARELLDDEVTVEVNPPVVCVQEPCDQEPLVVVCVVRLNTCTA